MSLTDPVALKFLINCRVLQCGTSVSGNRPRNFLCISSVYSPRWNTRSTKNTRISNDVIFTMLYTDHWLTYDRWRMAKIWRESVGVKDRLSRVHHCWRLLTTTVGTLHCNTLFSQVLRDFTATLFYFLPWKYIPIKLFNYNPLIFIINSYTYFNCYIGLIFIIIDGLA
jgi:hypothetical protein